MIKTGKYTCTDYRQEMILLGLRQRLFKGSLSDSEKKKIQDEIRKIESQMGMD